MSIYIYKQCPPPNRGRGSKKTSSCGSPETTQTQVTQIATWMRDMGDQMTVMVGGDTNTETARGRFFAQFNGSGTVNASTSAGLCDWENRGFNRFFEGEFGSANYKFTPCGGGDCGRLEDDNGTFQMRVRATLRDWVYDTGCPGGLDGPTYSCESHWTFPRVCVEFFSCSGKCGSSIRGICTEFCYNGTQAFYGAGSGGGGAFTGNWNFDGNAFNFKASWYYQWPGEWPCGYCWNQRTKPCSSHSSGYCCCSDGPYLIWTKGQMYATVTKGPKSSLRCAM